MPNAYLAACHRYITREMKQAEVHKQKAESRGDTHQVAFYAGQVDELLALRGYLSEHFNLTTQRYY